MSEKSTKSNLGQKIVQPLEKPESDKVFLERKNVKVILTNLVDSLLHHQPKDPFNFIYN